MVNTIFAVGYQNKAFQRALNVLKLMYSNRQSKQSIFMERAGDVPLPTVTCQGQV